MSKVILITGASSGIGRSLAEAAVERGHKVVATARKIDSLKALASKYPDQLMAVTLDVNQRESIRLAFEQAVQRFGRIDVLVNNAGFGLIGAVEEFSEGEIQDQFDTNVYGVIRSTQEALCYMRSQRSGHIINISSVAGFVGYAGSALYAASKHAIEGLSQGLACEVAEFGIHVTVVNPGPFRTNFAGTPMRMPDKKIEAYAAIHARQSRMRTEVNGNQSGDPISAAHAILDTVGTPNPPFTLPLGAMAFDEIPSRLRRTLNEIEAVKSIGLPTDFLRA